MDPEIKIRDADDIRRLLAAYAPAGATQKGLGDFLALDKSGISRMLSVKPGTKPRRLQAEEVPKIEAYFKQYAINRQVSALTAHVPDPLGPIPVRGTAGGAYVGSFDLSDEVVRSIERPPALAGARGIYAIYVVGSSMEPEHRTGDLRLVNPHRPAGEGDSVIVLARYRENGPVQAFIGHLVAQSQKEVTIRKLSPAGTIVKFEPRFVVAVHKVMSIGEILGA